MKYTLKILPQIEPKIRHKIEDVLKSEGFNVTGGGQTITNIVRIAGVTQKSFSDISFEDDK